MTTVVYALTLVVIVAILTLAWLSTGLPPFIYNFWLVQMQTRPQRRVLQVMHLEDDEALRLERELTANRTSQLLVTTSRVDRGSDSATLTRWHVAAPGGGNNAINASEEAANAATVTRLQVEIQEVNPQSGDAAITDDEDSSSSSALQSTSNSSTNALAVEESATNAANAANGVEGGSANCGASSAAPDATIRLKFLDDTHRQVATWLTATVGEFKRQYFTPALAGGRVVRLIYRGQLLRDDGRSLASYGLHDNCIVHAHVSNTPLAGGATNAGNRPLDAGTAGSAAGGMRATVRAAFDEARELLESIGGGDGTATPGESPDAPFQIGRYLNYIFAFKFVALWTFVFMCPQWVDAFSVTLLAMLTVAYASFLVVGRAVVSDEAMPQQEENRGEN